MMMMMMMMSVEHSVEWELAEETEVLGENLPMPICPPYVPHELIRDRTLAAAVRSRRLTAWAVAQPKVDTYIAHFMW
jgi:hypothetical protein